MPPQELLSQCDRAKLRRRGRDALYRSIGVSRDSPLEEAAIAALGANALEHKRAECQKRFMATTRDEQVQLLPEFHAYHVDTDAREAADAAEEAAAASAGDDAQPGEPQQDAPMQEQHLANAARVKRARDTIAVFLKKKKGRRAQGFRKVRKRQQNRGILRTMLLVMSLCTTTDDVASLLAQVVKRMACLFPGLAAALAELGVNVECRCESMSSVFKKLSEHSGFLKHADSKAALAEAAIGSGFSSRRAASKIGIQISRRTWKGAKQEQGTKLPQRGRPSLCADPNLQQLVTDVANANSRDSSKLMVVKGLAPEPQAVTVRP